MSKKIKRIILTILLLLSMFICYYIYTGYRLYKKTIDTCDIQEVINAIQNQKNYITIDQIPAIYHDAVIAVEDPSFYKHDGINLLAIFKAFIRNVGSMDYVEGGSTITQQIAKNLFFTQEKKIDRKVAEVFMVHQLEYYYTKEELFEIYINAIYYGDGYYGIYDASIGYFGKEPSELTDNEATLLAGIPNAPSIYALSNDYQLAKERQKTVIDAMIKHHYLTQEEGDLILEHP